MRTVILSLLLTCAAAAQPRYDLLLKGGHVIDPKNGINGPMDIAIGGGKIARVARAIDASEAKTTADVTRLYVTPGLIDIHTHLYIWPDLKGEGVQPDAFSFRSQASTNFLFGFSLVPLQ